ncbi:MAG: hypothetical protein AAB574_03930 [Patescibacteria group bacterium]
MVPQKGSIESSETSQPYEWFPTAESRAGIVVRPTPILGSRPVATGPTSPNDAILAAITEVEEVMYN